MCLWKNHEHMFHLWTNHNSIIWLFFRSRCVLRCTGLCTSPWLSIFWSTTGVLNIANMLLWLICFNQQLNTTNPQQISEYVLRTWLEPNLWNIRLSTLVRLAGRRGKIRSDPTGSQGIGKVHDAYALLCLSAYSSVVHTGKTKKKLNN